MSDSQTPVLDQSEVVQLLQQRQEARVTAYQCQAKRTTRVT